MRMTYENLSRVMEQKELNYNDIRLNAKIPMTILAKICNGENIPSQYINRICNYLECKPHEIITLLDEPEVIRETQPKRKTGAILQYKNEKYVRRFNSVREAGRYLKKEPSAISRCINGKCKTAYGSTWKREEL